MIIGVLLALVLLLTACGGVAGDSWAGISSDENLIYVSYGRRVVAINPASGATKWEYPDEDDRDANFYAIPVMDAGTLYIGDYKGNLHAVDLETGKKKWLYEPDKEELLGPISLTPGDRVISGVAVDSNKVFFGLGSRNVVAVSRENAEEVWTFKTDHGVWGTPLYIPANAENGHDHAVLYVVSLDHNLYAIDPETGKEIWRVDLGGAAPGNMVYDEARNWVYVGTFVSELLAIDLGSHRIVDRYATEDWVWGSPALEDDILYFGDLAGHLYAVRITGEGFEQEWKQTVAEDAIRGTPLLTEDLVVVGSRDKRVYAVLKSDGSDKWNRATKGEVLTEMVFVPANEADEEVSDLVVVGTSEREELVIALKSDSGDVDWRYSDKD